MRFNFKYKNKKIGIDVKKCNSFEKFIGLMFTKKNKAKALLFDFEKSTRISIHSCFVFFDFFAIWFDENNNNIIEIQKVKPWRLIIKPKKPYSKLIEIPINEEYNEIVKLLN